MNREVEFKFTLENRSEVLNYLNSLLIGVCSLNIKYLGKVHQIDTYYNNTNDSYITDKSNITRLLRIRTDINRENSTCNMLFKQWTSDFTCCNEYSVGVSSKEDCEELLSAIGFVPLVVVDKIRDTFLYKDCEIAIDTVEGLGDFIEVEYKGTISDTKQIREFLCEVVSELNIEGKDCSTVGYPQMLILKN